MTGRHFENVKLYRPGAMMCYLLAFGLFQIRILTRLRAILTDIKVQLFTMLSVETAVFWVLTSCCPGGGYHFFRNKLLLPFSG